MTCYLKIQTFSHNSGFFSQIILTFYPIIVTFYPLILSFRFITYHEGFLFVCLFTCLLSIFEKKCNKNMEKKQVEQCSSKTAGLTSDGPDATISRGRRRGRCGSAGSGTGLLMLMM